MKKFYEIPELHVMEVPMGNIVSTSLQCSEIGNAKEIDFSELIFGQSDL